MRDCNSVSARGYHCSRLGGHLGPHRYWIGHVKMAEWSDPTPPGIITVLNDDGDAWRRCESRHNGRQCYQSGAHVGKHYGYDARGHDFQQWEDPPEPSRQVATVSAPPVEALSRAFTEAIARRERAWAEYTKALEAENIASQAYYAARAREDS